MSSKIDISVVMPVYNRAYCVAEAINSILDQSFTNWELIIVDDGSTDQTPQICQRFTKVDSRIKFYRIPHTGKIGKVRNYGNQRSHGRLIVVQDSDDISLPDRLDVLWSEYQHTKADVLYTAVYRAYHNKEFGVLRKFAPAEPYNKAKLFHTQYIPGQVAYTKEAITKIPYNDDILISDDWLLLLEFALNDFKFHSIQRAVYEYRYTHDSVTYLGNDDNRKAKDSRLMIKVLKNKYKIKVAKFQLVKKDLDTGKVLKDETYT